MLRGTNAEQVGRARLLRRRSLLKLGALAGVLLLPMPALAHIAPHDPERTLRLYNLHTGERVHATFWAEGRYVTDAFSEFDHILRDHETNAVRPIDPQLIELLYRIQSKLETQQGLDVISGYRSPKTNARLVREGRTHARHSYHITGQAVDFRVPGRDLRRVRAAAMGLRAGGVGYYPRSHFIHADTGPVRHW